MKKNMQDQFNKKDELIVRFFKENKELKKFLGTHISVSLEEKYTQARQEFIAFSKIKNGLVLEQAVRGREELLQTLKILNRQLKSEINIHDVGTRFNNALASRILRIQRETWMQNTSGKQEEVSTENLSSLINLNNNNNK